MAEETELEGQIAESAVAAQSVSIDGTTTTEHSLPDQITADKYLRSTQAMRRRCGVGVSFKKIIPHGSVW